MPKAREREDIPMSGVDVAMAYAKRFGAAGAFDTWLLPPNINVRLMQHALARGKPVSHSVLDRIYQRLYGATRDQSPPPPHVIL